MLQLNKVAKKRKNVLWNGGGRTKFNKSQLLTSSRISMLLCSKVAETQYLNHILQSGEIIWPDNFQILEQGRG